MKKLIIPFLLSLLFFVSCTQQPSQQNSVSVSSNNLPGFNVSNFAQLLRTTKDPQSLEQSINTPNNNINNLDLDNNSQVDYLRVVESQPGSFQVIDQTSNSQSIVVATVNINSQNDTVNINGNQSYCGNNYNYTSHFTVGDYLFMAYILHPHQYYTSAYHYGYYPSYYHTTVVRRTYVSSSSNSNVNKASVPQRSSLSKPVTSQRSFTTRNTNTPVRTGGFGNKTTPSGGGFGGHTTRSSFGHGGGFGRHK